MAVVTSLDVHAQSVHDVGAPSSYALTLHEGSEHHRGAADLSGALVLSSTGEVVVAEIRIQDDQLLKGDHINVWFSILGEQGAVSYRYPTKFALSDSTLVCLKDRYRNRRQPIDFLLEEVKDPLITCSNPHREYRKSGLDSLSQYLNNTFFAEYVDEYLPTPASVQQTSVFYGITGLRIDLALDSLSLIEPEAYAPIEKAAQSSRADWLSYAVLERSDEQDNVVTLTLPPEALGFMHRAGYQELNVLMEVIDVDDEGITRFSTAPDDDKDNPDTFPGYQVDPPITLEAHQ